ncbi:M48 family metallopeptidase [Candidatus Omnitrophota bacterium]
MNVYLAVILAVLAIDYFLGLVVESLNLKSVSPDVPEEFKGFYDAEKYARAQEYLRVVTRFGLVKDTFFFLLTLGFILAGGFNLVDSFARSFGGGTIATGLIFAAVVIWGLRLISIPFSVYRTFVIEARFGFNKTTAATFVTDMFKSLVISSLIGAVAFAAIIWFFLTMSAAWFYCWVAISLFQLFLTFIAPIVILPLFNTFVPLEDGELKTAIEDYARSQKFLLSGVFTIDASRRSTKSNAYFTGLGKYRRIALFDTLIAKHTVGELVSVLAHEIGHYKKKHILKSQILSIAATGALFLLLSFFINNPGLFAAFKMEQLSVYASLFFFGFLYTPVSMVFSLVASVISRKHEFEADRYVADTFSQPEAFILALKKLSVDNLSNLSPHPLKVFLQYSHPPVLQRIAFMRGLIKGRP